MHDISNFNPNRELLDLPKILKHYGITEIKVAIRDDNNPKASITVPINFDLIVNLKLWISYETDTDKINISKRLISQGNYWVTQLIDDHKNKRINLKQYIYER
jgi:hypothetical protein